MLDRRSFLIGAVGLALRPWRMLEGDAPKVRVRQGVLVGQESGGLRVFRGIPFAKPPVGELRFRAPLPPEDWVGERMALENARPAMQNSPNGSEDCLYLNIWAPKGEGPFPVLVWIHGGGNVGGGTNGMSGAGFARDGVIVVTVAYRLGAFGYLKLDDLLGAQYAGSEANGTRDLIAALTWVNENIAAFGGDPARVTIAGQSAGAKNVAALMASPKAKGLFARAIMQSGGGHTAHSPAQAHEVTLALLAALNIQPGEAEKLLTLKSEELLDGQKRMMETYPHNYPFRPGYGNSVLPKIPVEGLNSGIPLLLGTNRDESLVFFSRESVNKPIASQAIANIPFARIAEIEAKYKATYPDLSPLDLRLRLISAEEYWMPSVRFAEAHARQGGKTWMYRFDHASTDERDANRGYAVHASEMEFVWNHREGWAMHEAWLEFINGLHPREWPQFEVKDRKTKIFGQDGKTEVVKDPRGDERRLWDKVM